MIDCMKKYDYRCLMQDAAMLCQKYPEKISMGIAGYSVCGRKLIWLSVGTGKKVLLMLGTHHGREYIGSAYLMRLCEAYLETAPKEFLEQAKIVFLPMVNPDGAEISIHGSTDPQIAAMPRLNGTYSSWKANANGVDLNRNYPCLWEKKNIVIDRPASEMYNGEAAASEPEVRAAMRLTEHLKPDLAITIHAKGEEIYYGDSNTPQIWEESYRYASVISELSGYVILEPSKDPSVYAAGYENWFREQYKKPCILVELGKYDGPEPFRERRFETEIWEKLQKIGTELIFRLIYT